jgi:hypothetical protein
MKHHSFDTRQRYDWLRITIRAVTISAFLWLAVMLGAITAQSAAARALAPGADMTVSFGLYDVLFIAKTQQTDGLQVTFQLLAGAVWLFACILSGVVLALAGYAAYHRRHISSRPSD